MAYTVYTVGDLQILRQALTGVAMMFDPGNNTILNSNAGAHLGSAAGMGALISLTIILVKGIYNQAIRLEELLICVVMYTALFVPKITVTLEDVYNGTTTVVSKVPVGVAMPAVLMSGVVYSLTQKMDVAFSTTNGNYVGLTEEGFVSPLKLFVQLRNGPKKDVSQEFAGSMMEYFRYCVKDSSGGVKADESLMKSDNLSNYFANNNVNAMTYFYTSSAILASPASGATPAIPALPVAKYPGAGLLVSCSQAGYLLSDYMVKWASNNLGAGNTSSDKSIRWAVGNSNKAAVSNSALFGSSLQSLVGTGSYNADAVLINIAFSNLILDMRSRGGIADPDMAISSFTMTEAMERWKADQVGAGEIFQKTMNQSMSVFLFLFFAMAPIVGVVTAIMGMAGIKLLLSYFMFGIWTQSWLPVAAVINFYVQSTVETELGRLLAPINFGALSANMNGSGYTVQELFSPALIDSTYNLLTQKLAMASSMMSLVPTITAAVLGGGMFALTSLAGKMGGQGGYFGEKKIAGNDISKTTGVESALSGMYERGVMGFNGPAGGAVPLNKAQISNSIVDTVSNSKQNAVQGGVALQNQLASEVAASHNRLFTSLLNHNTTYGTGVHASNGDKASFGNNKTLQAIENLATKTGFAKTKQSAIDIALAAGGSLAAGNSLAGLKGALQIAEKDTERFDQSKGAEFLNGLMNITGLKNDESKEAMRSDIAAIDKKGQIGSDFKDVLGLQTAYKNTQSVNQSLNESITKSSNQGEQASAVRNVFLLQDLPALENSPEKGIVLSNVRSRLQEAAREGVGSKETRAAAGNLLNQLSEIERSGGSLKQVGQLIGSAGNSTDANVRAVGEMALSGAYEGSPYSGYQAIGRGIHEASSNMLKLANIQAESRIWQKAAQNAPGATNNIGRAIEKGKKEVTATVGSIAGEAQAGTSQAMYDQRNAALTKAYQDKAAVMSDENKEKLLGSIRENALAGYDTLGIVGQYKMERKVRSKRDFLDGKLENLRAMTTSPDLSREEQIEAKNALNLANRYIGEFGEKYRNPGAYRTNQAELKVQEVAKRDHGLGHELQRLNTLGDDAMKATNGLLKRHPNFGTDVLDTPGS